MIGERQLKEVSNCVHNTNIKYKKKKIHWLIMGEKRVAVENITIFCINLHHMSNFLFQLLHQSWASVNQVPMVVMAATEYFLTEKDGKNVKLWLSSGQRFTCLYRGSLHTFCKSYLFEIQNNSYKKYIFTFFLNIKHKNWKKSFLKMASEPNFIFSDLGQTSMCTKFLCTSLMK